MLSVFDRKKNGYAVLPDRVPDYEDYLKPMRKVAGEKLVSMFRMYGIMMYWVESGQFHVDQMLSIDQFQMADSSYSCLGSELADALEADLERHQRTARSRVLCSYWLRCWY